MPYNRLFKFLKSEDKGLSIGYVLNLFYFCGRIYFNSSTIYTALCQWDSMFQICFFCHVGLAIKVDLLW